MFRTLRLHQLAALTLVLSLSGAAQAGQKHPGYARTIDDLRLARALLQRTNASGAAADAQQDEVSLTIANIDGAIDEMSKEIASNGKKPHAIARINPRMPWSERLSESLRLIAEARQDCAKEKDNPGNPGVKARVLDQLNQANTRITVAIETINFDYDARNLPTRND